MGCGVWSEGRGIAGASFCGNLQRPLNPGPLIEHLSCGIWPYFTLNVLFM